MTANHSKSEGGEWRKETEREREEGLDSRIEQKEFRRRGEQNKNETIRVRVFIQGKKYFLFFSSRRKVNSVVQEWIPEGFWNCLSEQLLLILEV